MKNVDKFAVAETILAAAVANNGTFTVGYPSGTSQKSFTAGLAGPNSYMVVNDNDRYAVGTSGFTLAFGSSNITVTNVTGATLAASAKILLAFDQVDGNEVETLFFPVELASITGTQDVVTDFRPGFDGVIEDVFFVVDKAVSTGSKLATLNLEVNTTDLTGGTIALTSAGATPMGKIIEAAAITAGNVFTRDDAISIEASSVTAFAEGSGTVVIRCRKTRSDAY